MAIHITASGAATVSTSGPRGIEIAVNTGLTGTVTVTDGTGTLAVITNPAAGQTYTYFGLLGTVTVNPSGTCDLTVSILSQRIR